jgi:hypothetical protein
VPIDVDSSVVAVAEGVVIDPDVGRSLLDIDGVVIPTAEGDIADDDVLDPGEIQAATGDPRGVSRPR